MGNLGIDMRCSGQRFPSPSRGLFFLGSIFRACWGTEPYVGSSLCLLLPVLLSFPSSLECFLIGSPMTQIASNEYHCCGLT
jgi:hypothetical protein